MYDFGGLVMSPVGEGLVPVSTLREEVPGAGKGVEEGRGKWDVMVTGAGPGPCPGTNFDRSRAAGESKPRNVSSITDICGRRYRFRLGARSACTLSVGTSCNTLIPEKG